MGNIIPEALRARPNWIVWEGRRRDGGKLDKRPRDPRTGDMAKSNDPTTWRTYDEAVDALQRGGTRYAGIGYMFDGTTFGVDIDGCFDGGNLVDSNVPEILATFDSYTEMSPSGTGLHIICLGKLPEGAGRRHEHYEIYGTGRFFTVTGRPYGEPRALRECSAEAAAFIARYIDGARDGSKKPARSTRKSAASTPIGAGVTIDDAEIDALRARIEAGKSAAMFRRLFAGDTSAHGGDDSAADLALCNIIAPRANGNAAMVDALFRRSGLMRAKWDEMRGTRTYGEGTVAKALDGWSGCNDGNGGSGGNECNGGSGGNECNGGSGGSDGNECNGGSGGSDGNECNGGSGGNPAAVTIYGYTDQDNARRLYMAHGKDYKYCMNHKTWYVWTGTHWAGDMLNTLALRTDQLVEAMRAEALARNNKAMIKGADASAGHNRRENMIKDLRHYEGVAIRPEQLDVAPMLFSARNGTIDLHTGEIRPHRRADLITRVSPVACDYDMPTPRWAAFLFRIFAGDMDMIEFIQRAIGYSLTGSTAEQCMFLCLGAGANGKSTMFDVLAYVAGGYAANVQPETIMAKRGARDSGSAQADIARLAGVRLATMEEPDEGIKVNEPLIKQMTGSGSITARFLNANFFEFKPTMKMWMGANHEPIIAGTDDGIWRRMRLIPFEVQIPPGERDGQLLDKLKEEAPGILAWAVRGAVAWAAGGLQPPEKVMAATARYRSGMDLMQAFLDDCTVPEAGGKIGADRAYKLYAAWADSHNIKPLSGAMFGRELAKRYPKTRGSSGHAYNGIMEMVPREGAEMRRGRRYDTWDRAG